MINYLVFRKTRSVRESIFKGMATPLVMFYRNLFKGKKLAWGETRDSLKRFDEGSIGKEISLFLYQEGFEVNPRMESHDVFHVLTGFGTAMHEEAAMQFFLIGNGKKSKLARLAAVFGFFIFPEYWRLYRESYKRGKQTLHFSSWDFKELLFVDVEQFRRDVEMPEREI